MDIRSTVTLNNGNAMPALGLGTWNLRGRKAEQAALWALECGYRLVDTATVYGNETEIGNALRARGVAREELFVTTKLWSDDLDDPASALAASLQRLGLSSVDLYLIHWPNPPHHLRAWKVLETLYEQGLAKAIGVSNFTIGHLEELARHASVVPAVNQVELSPFLYQRELLAYCNKHAIQLEAYSPLTRKEKLRDKRLVRLAAKYRKSPAQILLRWDVQHGIVAIPKASQREHIEENADIFDYVLEASDMELLDSLNENARFSWYPRGWK